MVGSRNSVSAVSRNTFVLWLLIYQSSTVHCQLCQIILHADSELRGLPPPGTLEAELGGDVIVRCIDQIHPAVR